MPKAAQDIPSTSLERVASWLADRTRFTWPLTATRISGGRSNLTYRLLDGGGRQWVLRRPPHGQILHGAHDMSHEHRILTALSDTAIPIPSIIGYCGDERVIGAEFFVMDFVEGLTLQTTAEVGALDDEARARLGREFPETLAELHAIDPQTANLGDVSRGRDYVQRQLRIWQRQLNRASGRDLPLMDDVAARLSRQVPQQRHVSVVHGDFRLDNVLVGPDGTIRAVVDWELGTLGDPLADLGQTLVYWADPEDQLLPLGAAPTTAEGMPRRAEVIETYAERCRFEISDAALAFHVAFGTWRFAAILEGVYQRNLAGAYGEGPDDGWRRFEHVVPAMAERSAEQLSRAGLRS